MMRLNADFSLRATVTPDDHQWVTSPQSGVERMMLDRIGDEQARATSLVKYAADSQFPVHSHPSGEEILVLSGTFSEDGVDYPAGWYLRSPDGSSHQPSSQEGATIFVKLRQMTLAENQRLRIDTRDPKNWSRDAQGYRCSLYHSATESVSIQQFTAGESLFSQPLTGGAELLVLEGDLIDLQGHYPQGSWLRLPAGTLSTLTASAAGARCYLKTGHLNEQTLIGVKRDAQ